MPRTLLRLSTLALALWVACAPGIVAVPAAAMTPQLGMSDEAGAGGCDVCPEMDVDRGVCPLACAGVAFLALTAEPPGLAAARARSPVLAGRTLLLGQPPAPDPAPPKFVLS